MFGISQIASLILGYVLIGLGVVVLISLLIYTLKSKIFSDSKYITLINTSKKSAEEIKDEKKVEKEKTTVDSKKKKTKTE